jgi:hypothetical protein
VVRRSEGYRMNQQPAAQSASELAGVIPKITAVQNKARSRFLSLYRQEPQLDWRLNAEHRHEGSVTIEQT